MADKLKFLRVTDGELMEVQARIGDAESPAGEYLMARTVHLDGGPELRQHRPAGGSARLDGYERLDNEILAGRRLHHIAPWGSYPPEVAELYGDEATSADPYALFEPYKGLPLRDVGTFIVDDGHFDAFLMSFLTGLCWIAGAGMAHRAINPDTVRWDNQQRRVQITDFSRSTVFGVPRTPVMGSSPWVPREQKPGTCYGTVGPRDDIWAAGQLIFFVRNQGEDLINRSQIAESGLDEMFSGLFDRMLDPPESRPTAADLVKDGLGQRVPLPTAADGGARLMTGRERFLQVRRLRHPGAAEPEGFNADIDWLGDQGDGPSARRGDL